MCATRLRYAPWPVVAVATRAILGAGQLLAHAAARVAAEARA